MGVMECEMLRPMALARMTSHAALYGNPSTDVKKGGDAIQQNYVQAFDCLPYLKAAIGNGKSDVGSEREQAMERFRQWRDTGYKVGPEK